MTTSNKRRIDKPAIVTPKELKQQLEQSDSPQEGLLKLTAQQFAQAHLQQWDRGGWLQWVKLRSGMEPNARLTLPEWLDVFERYSTSPAGGGQGA